MKFYEQYFPWVSLNMYILCQRNLDESYRFELYSVQVQLASFSGNFFPCCNIELLNKLSSHAKNVAFNYRKCKH